MAQCLTNWLPTSSSTSVHSFYPSGVLFHGANAKSVILVWSRHTIKTCIFRDLSRSIHQDLAPSKCNLLHLPPSMELAQVVVGTNESFVLTSSGNILSFRTAKTLQQIPHLTDVRCACATKTGFAMIRLASPDAKSIFVSLQPDNFNPDDNASLCRTFDISLETNLCQSTWTDSVFCIKEFQMRPDNPQLFDVLQNRKDDTSDNVRNSCLIISINNNLLSLVWGETDDDDFQVHLVQSFESTIVNMWPSEAGEALFVLQQSGSLDVLHCCGLTQIGLRRSRLYISDHVDCLDIFNDLVVYSNGTHVVQSKVSYDKASMEHSLIVLQQTAIFGVVAITLIDLENILLVVTENNLIYKIGSQANVSLRSEDLSADAIMRVVDDNFVKRAKSDLASIVRLTNSYEEVREHLLRHQYDNRLMAKIQNANKDCKTLFAFIASIAYDVSCLPCDENTFFIHAVNKGSEDLTLSIKMAPSGKTPIDLSHKNWFLCIEEIHLDQNTVRTMPITENMLQQPLTIRIQPSSESNSRLSIPQFRISIATLSSVGDDKLSFQFPVATTQPDISKLFKLNAEPAIIQQQALNRFERRKNKHDFIFTTRLPPSLSYENVFTLFNSTSINDNPVTTVFINLLGRSVQLIKNTNDLQLLTLSSNDALALFYIKQFILLRLHSLYDLQLRTDLAKNSIRMTITKCQSIKDRREETSSSVELDRTEIDQILKCVCKLRESLAEFYLCKSFPIK